MDHTVYNNPLVTRYATREMSEIFSEQHRIGLFRRLWLALAKGEQSLGLDITDEQIAELEAYVDDINFDVANAREKVTRPFSSGSRNTSNAERENSANSSKNGTPLCAKDTSPGRGVEPPPIRATSEMVWCGSRNGRRVKSLLLPIKLQME